MLRTWPQVDFTGIKLDNTKATDAALTINELLKVVVSVTGATTATPATVAIDGATDVMTVTLKDIDDNALWSINLEPK